MIPVPGLDQVRVAWVLIKGEEYTLFGFLLYTNSDRALVDYMRDGMLDLDVLSGDQCAIFVIESPSKEWITYAQKGDHSWWRIYGKSFFNQVVSQPQSYSSNKSKLPFLGKTIVENNSNCVIVVGDENITLEHILEPEINLLYNRAEAYRVAKHFNVRNNELPCIIFFESLDSNVIWKAPLGNLLTQAEVRNFFRDFFESSDFLSLLR